MMAEASGELLEKGNLTVLRVFILNKLPKYILQVTKPDTSLATTNNRYTIH